MWHIAHKNKDANRRDNVTKTQLTRARLNLGLSSAEMAQAMGTEYGTFKKWQNGTRRITGASQKCVELLLAIKGTTTGARFGV